MAGRYGMLAGDSETWVVEISSPHGWQVCRTIRRLMSQDAAVKHLTSVVRPRYPYVQIRTRQTFDAKSPRQKFFVRWEDEHGGRVVKKPTDYETASEQYKRGRQRHENVELVAIVPGGEKIVARGGQRRTSPAKNYVAGGTHGSKQIKRSSSAVGLSNPPPTKVKITKRP